MSEDKALEQGDKAPAGRKPDLVCVLCRRELNCPVVSSDLEERTVRLGMLMIQHFSTCHTQYLKTIALKGSVYNAVMMAKHFEVGPLEVAERFAQNQAKCHEWLNQELEVIAQPLIVPVQTKVGQG